MRAPIDTNATAGGCLGSALQLLDVQVAAPLLNVPEVVGGLVGKPRFRALAKRDFKAHGHFRADSRAAVHDLGSVLRETSRASAARVMESSSGSSHRSLRISPGCGGLCIRMACLSQW